MYIILLLLLLGVGPVMTLESSFACYNIKQASERCERKYLRTCIETDMALTDRKGDVQHYECDQTEHWKNSRVIF